MGPSATPATPCPVEAPHLGNNGQLSRDERVQLYGIDCDDQAGFDGDTMITMGYTFQYTWKKHVDNPFIEDFHRETMSRSEQLADLKMILPMKKRYVLWYTWSIYRDLTTKQLTGYGIDPVHFVPWFTYQKMRIVHSCVELQESRPFFPWTPKRCRRVKSES